MRFAFAVVMLLAVPARGQDRPADSYHVVIDDGAAVATVTGRLNLRSSTLSMYNVTPVEGLPNGQASLIGDLTITAGGAPVAFRDVGQGDFEVERTGPVEVSYTVRLDHDRYRWPFGKEEVAYRTPEGLMTTGYALFLADASDQGAGPFEVSFDLPAGWRAQTPWAPAAEGRFRVPTRRDLLVNALFLGSAHAETIEAGGLTLTLVLGAPFVGDRETFAGLLRAQSDAYHDLFGAPPGVTRFLVVINQDPASDGGAFAGSFSQLIAGEATPASLGVWGVAMAHELLHFWNGLTLVPADDREEWFKEGVTDYLTTATLARNGYIDGEMTLKRIENWPRRVLWARFGQGLRMSVRDAGADKAANRQLIYGGGAAAALALDVEMRVRSADRVGLPDLVRALYAERDAGGYDVADIARVAGELTGTDFRPFLADAVESEGLLDLRPALDALGLRLDQFFDEVYVSHDAEATPAQRARFGSVFGPAAGPAAALEVVERFHAALAAADSAVAMALLAPDAVILEAGGAETRAEYAAHHLAADSEFARDVTSRRTPLAATVEGDVAWVAQASESTGTFRGRDVDSAGAELIVLARTPDGWRIRAIHWSARSRR